MGYSSGGTPAAGATSADSGTLVGTGVTVQAVFEELDNAIVAAEGALTTHAGTDLAAAVHGFKGIVKFLVNGATEVIAEDEIQTLTLTGGVYQVNEVKILTAAAAGLENDLFKLTTAGTPGTAGAGVSAAITLPSGGFASLTAAAVKAAMLGGTMLMATGDVAVTGNNGGPFTITYGGTLVGTNIGNMTVTDSTGDLIAAPFTVTDDGTGASFVGSAADHLHLTFNAHEGTTPVTMPTGGFANVTAASVKTALLSISDWTTKTADIAVVKTLNDYAITFTGTLAAGDVGAITVTNPTGAGAGSVAETNKGVVATVYTVTGIAVGDSLAPVLCYATKASLATQTLRPASDFTVGAGTLTVAANPIDNNNNELLVEWVDLT